MIQALYGKIFLIAERKNGSLTTSLMPILTSGERIPVLKLIIWRKGQYLHGYEFKWNTKSTVLAMPLGTNYPNGTFECITPEQIGIGC